MATLPNISANEKALLAEIEALKAKLAAKSNRSISFKVTAPKLDEKTGEMKGTSGAVSLYGLGRFPITLYRDQWKRLVGNIAQLEAFMEANADKLSSKSDD